MSRIPKISAVMLGIRNEQSKAEQKLKENKASSKHAVKDVSAIVTA